METNFEKLKKVISEETLILPDEKDELIRLFSNANDEDLLPVLELVSSDPSWILKLSKNCKAKNQTIKNKDMDAWDKIVAEEEKELLQAEN